MKRLIILLLVFVPMMVNAQSPSLSNPFYLVFTLINQPSEEKMEDICKFYSLTKESEREGFHCYTHMDGTTILFKIDSEDGKSYPVVRIFTKENKNTIDKLLIGAGFTKEGDEYVKGSKFESRQTKCKVKNDKLTTIEFYKIYSEY